jgi:Tol biopolymer transport system component
MMRTHEAAAALIAVLVCQTGQPVSVHTIVQADSLRMPLESPSATVSADGRYIAFVSYAPLAPADTNRRGDVYVLDRSDGHVTLESLMPAGDLSASDSGHPRISADGRFLVYESLLAAHPPRSEIVLRDRLYGNVTIVSAGLRGEPADGISSAPEISRDGRVIVFSSAATNLVGGRDANGRRDDVYAFDVRGGNVTRISVDNEGVQPASGASVAPSVSGDGRYVAFASSATFDGSAMTTGTGFPPGRPVFEVYVRDRERNVTSPVSRAGGRRPDGASWTPAMSADGRYVAFVSNATNLTPGDRNRSPDVFLANLRDGSIELISRGVGGGSANGASGRPAASADGRFVAFQSEASDILCARRCTSATEDINLLWDVFVLDRQGAAVTRVSGDAAAGWMEPSTGPSLDETGALVVFSSRHPIDASDMENDFDLFVWLRAQASGVLRKQPDRFHHGHQSHPLPHGDVLPEDTLDDPAIDGRNLGWWEPRERLVED